MFNPLQAIHVSNPTVFKLTVLPPVLGPVIRRVEYVLPKSIEIGTTAFGSIKGCLAFIKLILLVVSILGAIPLMDFE